MVPTGIAVLRSATVRSHLYAYDLDGEQAQRLLGRALTLWPEVTADLDAFTAWLGELRGAC